MGNLGQLLVVTGADHGEASRLLQEELALAEALDEPWSQGHAHCFLAALALREAARRALRAVEDVVAHLFGNAIGGGASCSWPHAVAYQSSGSAGLLSAPRVRPGGACSCPTVDRGLSDQARVSNPRRSKQQSNVRSSTRQSLSPRARACSPSTPLISTSTPFPSRATRTGVAATSRPARTAPARPRGRCSSRPAGTARSGWPAGT